MRRVVSWVLASIVTFILIISLMVGFVGSIAIGFVGAIQACGIGLIFGQEGVSENLVTNDPITGEKLEDPDSTETWIGDPGPESDTSSTAVAASKAYFDQFSASQQAEMKKNAALIVKIGANRPEKLTDHDIQAAIGVAIQESHITNLLVAVDHDSLGIYQQRPSAKTWGTAEQIVDPVHAINAFYDHLVKIDPEKRKGMTLVEIGIAVQNPSVSAYTRNWKWDDIAKEIVATYKTGGSSDLSGSICSASAGVSTGEWQLPLTEGSYCVLDGYGMRVNPYSHKTKMHNGIDLACDNGDPIYAAHAGEVTFAGSNGSLGNYVELDHGDVTTGYGHMVRIADNISSGGTVSAGQLLGYVGSTGGSTGPHLHFEVKVNGKFTEPIAFMEEQGVKIK